MTKYYFILLIHDFVMHEGCVFAASEEEAGRIIEINYVGEYDQYVVSVNPL